MNQRLLKAFVSLWLLFIVSCNNTEKIPDGREIASKTAPDNFGRAFVWAPDLDGLGATISQPYQVRLQSLKIGNQNSLILEADKTDGVNLVWKEPRQLEICYTQARIVFFQNFFVDAERDYPGVYEVEIVLRKVSNLGDC